MRILALALVVAVAAGLGISAIQPSARADTAPPLAFHSFPRDQARGLTVQAEAEMVPLAIFGSDDRIRVSRAPSSGRRWS